MRELLNRIRMNILGMPPGCGPDQDGEKSSHPLFPHEILYSSGTPPSRVDLADFLKTVAEQAHFSPESISINFRNVFLASDTAVYCGFIVRELLASVIRRPSGQAAISVDLFREGDCYSLVLKDDGSCFPVEADSESMSSRLVAFLAGQINGKIEFRRHPATEIRLRFMEPGLLGFMQI